MSLSIDKIKPASKRAKIKKKSMSEAFRPPHLGSVDTPHIKMKKQTPPTDESAQPRAAKEAKPEATKETKPEATKEAKLEAAAETEIKYQKESKVEIGNSSKNLIQANLSKRTATVKNLKKNQLKLAKYLYKKIEKENLSGSNKNSTGRMGPRQIAEEMQWDCFTVKLNIKRLREKKFLHTVERQQGNGGWTMYGLSAELIQHIKNTGIESF